MSDPVNVRGLAELQRTLEQLPAKVQEHVLVVAVSAGAKYLQDKIAQAAPVRADNALKKMGGIGTKARLPGFLKASIGRRRDDKGSGSSVTYNVGVITAAFYAKFIEFGTRHQAARPFLRPAVDSNQDGAVNRMADTLSRQIDAEAARLGLRS